jgi:hypothetical protein
MGKSREAREKCTRKAVQAVAARVRLRYLRRDSSLERGAASMICARPRHFMIDGCGTLHVNLKATEKPQNDSEGRKVVLVRLERG